MTMTSKRLGISCWTVGLVGGYVFFAMASISALAKERKAVFPKVVKAFSQMNELKQEAFADTFAGTILQGSGTVFEVSPCGWLDESKRWGTECYKVVLDAGQPRVALYYGKQDKVHVAELKKGQRFKFSRCVSVGIKDWGFWSTATCDMPAGASRASASKVKTAVTPRLGQKAKFPDVVNRFSGLNELKQEAFAETFAGTSLSGEGQVFEVGRCGIMDDSKKWSGECYKVTLDAGSPRVALYYGAKDKSKIAELNKGQHFTFKDCIGLSIKNWGFWCTATCDMP